MAERDGITPAEFGTAFKRFVDAMNAEAAKETSPLLERLRQHLGGDPGRIPIVTEDFGSKVVGPEHLDKAMDELAAGGELAKRIVGFGTSAYLPPAPSVGPMRPAGFPTIDVRRAP